MDLCADSHNIRECRPICCRGYVPDSSVGILTMMGIPVNESKRDCRTPQEEVLDQPRLGQQARPAALHHAAQGPAAHPHVKEGRREIRVTQGDLRDSVQDVYGVLARAGLRGGAGPGGRVHGAPHGVSGVPRQARGAPREAAAVLPAGDSESRG